MYDEQSIETAVIVKYSLITFLAIWSSFDTSHIIASPITFIKPEHAFTTI